MKTKIVCMLGALLLITFLIFKFKVFGLILNKSIVEVETQSTGNGSLKSSNDDHEKIAIRSSSRSLAVKEHRVVKVVSPEPPYNQITFLVKGEMFRIEVFTTESAVVDNKIVEVSLNGLEKESIVDAKITDIPGLFRTEAIKFLGD